MLALVFPAEVAPHPDVGPALAAGLFVDAALEPVPIAVGIGRRGLLLIQQVAQVEEMLLAGAPLGELGPLPLGDELLGSHRMGRPADCRDFVGSGKREV